MNKKIAITLFTIILAIGAFLRFYQLGNIPNSLNWDEVSWGYNAYSILQTGKDEYGNAFPLSFRAFGDFKQPMYVYLDTVAIKFFGLNGFSVRLPSAILGTLTIVSVFLLSYEIFRKQKYVMTLALLSMLFFATSPWSIQFSRVAYEANVALFFIITGSFLLIRGLNTHNTWYKLAGIVTLSLSGYTYHSAKVFTPLLFIGLLIMGKFLYNLSNKLLIGLLGFFLLCNILWIADARTTARGRSVMFTSNQTEILKGSAQQMIKDQEMGDAVGALFHNRRIVYANTYLENYLSHFDLNYLFIKGDNPRHHAPHTGVLLLISLPFIMWGIVYLISKKVYAGWIMFYWLLLAPAASALAVDAPNASRSLVFLPTWHIFTAIGVVAMIQGLRNSFSKKILVFGLFFAFFVNLSFYAYNYFFHTNREFGSYWQYGYREAVEYVKQFDGSNRNIYFTNDVEQAYVFYLFYNQYNPLHYIESGGSSRILEKCYSINNAYFGTCLNEVSPGDVLVTTKPPGVPNTANKIKEIEHLNGDSGVSIYRF